VAPNTLKCAVTGARNFAGGERHLNERRLHVRSHPAAHGTRDEGAMLHVSRRCARHTRCTDTEAMKDCFAAIDGVILGASPRANDVPEVVEHEPFEDEVTGEIVLLDVMRLELTDIEML
jgi:hypothetical protein